jgi:uncharacterized protein YcaQ
MEALGVRAARRLALARGGLLKRRWTGLPRRATGRGRRARSAAHEVIRRFGYLQLDTVSVAGARSHTIVLMSRIEGFDPALGEELLQPGEPLFEYWGHEASWLPIELYPVFEFRRKAFKHHPWWGDVVGEHPEVARRLRRRIQEEGPLRAIDMEGAGSRGWWDLKVAKKVASALWSSGELAIRERRNFQKSYDLTERVIPAKWRERGLPATEAVEELLLYALQGHGWAAKGTLTQTWRLRNWPEEIAAALGRLQERGVIVPCALVADDGKRSRGWIRPEDLELAARLERIRPRRDRGVLLSPFDPVLWDRARVKKLFSFEQICEIFKPAAKRKYGYYCLPVLTGDRLVARFDLKADHKAGRLHVLSAHYEEESATSRAGRHDREAARSALDRYAGSLSLKLAGERV